MYDIQFHIDGGLVGTSGMDSCARIWDLRSGKCLMVLQGHLKNVLSVDFSPNGLVTAGLGHAHFVFYIKYFSFRPMDYSSWFGRIKSSKL